MGGRACKPPASLQNPDKEEREPIRVKAPHDRRDVDGRRIRGMKVQHHRGAFAERVRPLHLGPEGAKVDSLEFEKVPARFNNDRPRHYRPGVFPTFGASSVSHAG